MLYEGLSGFNRLSPTVQSYLIRLYDSVIKTVSSFCRRGATRECGRKGGGRKRKHGRGREKTDGPKLGVVTVLERVP